jgi:hypothetical protein
MKILKKIIIIKLLLLFNLEGCNHYDRVWQLEVMNKLSYPIYVTVMFNLSSDGRYELGPIQPGEMANEIRRYDRNRAHSKANEEIYKIFVFSENKDPLMILIGKEMDNYVVFVGKNESDDYLFRFEVNEEDIGTYMGVD